MPRDGEFQFVTPDASVEAEMRRSLASSDPDGGWAEPLTFSMDVSSVFDRVSAAADVAARLEARADYLARELELHQDGGLGELQRRSAEALETLLMLSGTSSVPDEFVEPLAVLALVDGLLQQG